MNHFLEILVGMLLGVFLVHLFHRTSRRYLQQKCKDAETKLKDLQNNHVPSEFGTANSAEHIEFLYDKRLTLFNTRREHVWKIYFGAMFLLGVIDTAIVTDEITH